MFLQMKATATSQSKNSPLQCSGSIFVVSMVPPSFVDSRKQLSPAPMTRRGVLHFDDGLNGTRRRAGVAGGASKLGDSARGPARAGARVRVEAGE